MPDLTSKVLQLATGALEFVWDLPIAAKDSLPPEVKQFTIEVGGANTLYLNMDPEGKAGAKFADPRVRQAMSLAINRKAIADTAFAGLVKPLTSFWYDCPDICPTGMLPNGGVQDVEAAKKLMTEAGVPAEGITAEMLVSSTRGGWKEGATLVAADLEAIGVHLTVTPVDEATWNGAVANNNFEAIFNGGASSPQITMSSWFGNGFSATHSGYIKVPDHDKVVALIDQMAQETRRRQAQGPDDPDPDLRHHHDADDLARRPDRPRRHPPAGWCPQRREPDAGVHHLPDRRRAGGRQGRRLLSHTVQVITT